MMNRRKIKGRNTSISQMKDKQESYTLLEGKDLSSSKLPLLLSRLLSTGGVHLHLIGLLNLIVTLAYWYEFYGVVYDTSIRDDKCVKYLRESRRPNDYDDISLEKEIIGCTTDDMFFIRLKYISMSEVLVVSVSILILLWKSENRLRRLATYVSVCPLLVNMCVFLVLARGVLKERMRTNLVMLHMSLLLLTSRTLKGTLGLPSCKPDNTMMADAVLVILLLSSAAEMCFKLLTNDGIDRYTQDLTSVSKAGIFLFRLSAVDNATTAIFINFVRHFFSAFQKKVRILIIFEVFIFHTYPCHNFSNHSTIHYTLL